LPFVRTPVLAGARRLLAALRPALDGLERGLEAVERDGIVAALADALLALDPSAAGGPPASAACRASVERAREFLDGNFDRVVASEELEAVTGLDRYALARQFRALLGTSPYRYLTMRRLAHARSSIQAGDTLTDAALASGFADQSHMTRQFRQAFGLPPGRWRRLQLAGDGGPGPAAPDGLTPGPR
jgi:AraC-like DNA-binding protein